MWGRRPYFAGNGSKTGIEEQLSIADLSVYFDHDTTATITMEHGFTWSGGTKVTSAGVRRRPGSASNECGPGITKGGQLALSVMYATGTPSFAPQVDAFQTVATSVGIGITLDGQAESMVLSIGGACPSSAPATWACSPTRTSRGTSARTSCCPSA